jgi:hypothetical protein
MLRTLQGQKTAVAHEVDVLKKEKQKLEGIIAWDKLLLEQILCGALVNLKQQKPDLSTISDQEQIAKPVGQILRMIMSWAS